jgi:hypothetical protein
METFKKLFSKEFLAALVPFIFSLFELDIANEEKKKLAVDKATEIIEMMDDAVAEVPGWGWLLKLILDNNFVDQLQRQAVTLAVEALVFALKPIARK